MTPTMLALVTGTRSTILRGLVLKQGFVRTVAFLGLALAGAAAQASDLVVTVLDTEGRPVDHAVVMLEAEPGAAVGDWTPPPAVMKQQDMLFDPFVLPVRTGSSVNFPNLDEIRHHVYSFSKAKRFELRLYGQDETKTVSFDEPGIVALGCNIHDNMLSYIYVTDHPVYVVTDILGRATVRGLAPGSYRTFVWHPDLAGEGSEIAVPGTRVVDAGTAEATLEVDLRSVRRHQFPPREGDYR